VAKTTSIPPIALAQIWCAHRDHCRENGLVSKVQLASLIGTMVSFNWACPGSLALLNPLMAFIKPDTWDCNYSYRAVAPFITDAVFRFATLKPSPIQRTTGPVEDVFSDATETQIGIVAGDFMAAVTIKPTQIYDAEALAADWMLSQPLPPQVRLRTDNEALANALKKGRSNVPAANNACLRLLERRQQGHVITVAWIPTQDNPADLPSRTAISQQEFFVSPRRDWLPADGSLTATPLFPNCEFEAARPLKSSARRQLF
jgi:hypothetical protein